MKKYRIELTMACLLLVCFYLLSRQAAVISVNQAETTKGEAGPLILVDAGHGGSDPGMIGMGGLEEKGINLSISLFLRDTLEKSGYSGYNDSGTCTGAFCQHSPEQLSGFRGAWTAGVLL